MAYKSIPTSDAATVKKFAIKSTLETYLETGFAAAIRNGTINYAPELTSSGRGDQVSINAVYGINGIGQGEGGVMEGNEQAPRHETFFMQWNQYRQAVTFPGEGTIDRVRTYIDWPEKMRRALTEYHMIHSFEAARMTQLGGITSSTILVNNDTVYSGDNRLYVTGHNPVSAPTAGRHVWAGGKTADEDLTSSDTFRLDYIDAALENLRTSTIAGPSARPAKNQMFYLELPSTSITDLKRDFEGQITWYPNALAELTSGKSNALTTSLFSGKPVGEYNDVVILRNDHIQYGVHSGTSARIPQVRRAILSGADAGYFGSQYAGALADIQGEGSGSGPIQFKMRDFDYEEKVGLQAKVLLGFKKYQRFGLDNGSLVISHWSTLHTS